MHTGNVDGGGGNINDFSGGLVGSNNVGGPGWAATTVTALPCGTAMLPATSMREPETMTYVGGLVGHNGDSSTVQNSYATGNADGGRGKL